MEDNVPDLSRPQMYLFGCWLRSDKKEFRFEVEDDETEQQLSLKTVCVGSDAEDKFHVVEIEGVTYDGKRTKVPLVALKPSVLPSMSLGGFEITPPVTFRLQSGSGPIYISGQHFVSVRDSDDDEEENNSSPVKRPANLKSKKPSPKKLKMDSDDEDEDSDEDDDDEEDDDNEESDEDDVKTQKNSAKQPKKTPEPSLKKPKTAVKQNGSPGKAGGSAVGKPQNKPPPAGKGKTEAGTSKTLSFADIKDKLALAAKEGKPLPKTEQKFENFVKNTFRLSDKEAVKNLWSFVQTLKVEKK